MDTAAISTMMREVADAVIIPRFRSLSDEQVIEKNPGDLVTVADREAEVLITERLMDAYPGAVVVGEEACAERPDLADAVGHAEHVFTVDPVDGTKNFVHGSDDFGVMIGEMRGGETTRGWIWHPVHGTMWVSERGAGVTRNGESFTAAVAEPVLRGASSTPEHAGEYGALTLVNAKWSCAIDYPSLFTGDVGFLLYRGTNAWDHVPGMAMLNEFGGTLQFADGTPYRGMRGEQGLLATCSAVASQDVVDLAQRLIG